MTSKPTKNRETFIPDKTLVLILAALLVTSLVAIFAATPHLGAGVSFYYIRMQLIFYIISFSALLFICYFGVEHLFSLVDLLYIILMVLMFILVVSRFLNIRNNFIVPVNSTWAWYRIPGIGSFQPSEFMKVVLIIKSALIIDRHNKQKEKNSFSEDFKLLYKIGLYALPALILNFLQPDTGVPLIIVASLAIMFLISGVRREWFFILAIIILVGYFGIIYIYNNHIDLLTDIFGSSYRLNRFYAWLDYEKYRQGDGYQLYHAIISLGSGGIRGLGIGNASTYIPVAESDFIFASFGSTFGFIGSIYIIVLCFILDFKLLLLAYRSKNMVGKYAIAGVVGVLLYQQFQNIGMMIGVLPITGITLPFISYGGSSLLSYMVALSIPFAVSSQIANNPDYEAKELPRETVNL